MLRFNHGGRQLNAAPAAISSLPQIRNAVGHDMVLIFDGGVRHGKDIIKAHAAVADFVQVGRLFLHGLGAAGEKAFTVLPIFLPKRPISP